MKHIQRQIEPLVSIMSMLPIHERKMLEKQFIETSITTKFISNFKYHDLIPREGRMTWVIGSEGNHVPQSLLQAGSYAVMLVKPPATQYIDFTCNAAHGKSTYRYDHLVNAHIVRCSEFGADNTLQAAIMGQKILHNNLSSWSKIFELWQKHSRVSFHKSPTKFSNEKTLFVSLNPRKNICNELVEKAVKGSRVIIGDSECESIFDLCNRKHFDLDSRERSIKTMRNNLIMTDKIMEQRAVYLEGSQLHVLLNRVVTINEDMVSAAQDDTNGLKEIMLEAAENLKKWSVIAKEIATSQALSKGDADRLLLKAERLDMNSNKALARYSFNKSNNIKLDIALA